MRDSHVLELFKTPTSPSREHTARRSAGVTLAQFDAYTKALQVIRAEVRQTARTIVHARRRYPNVRERVVTVHEMCAHVVGVENCLYANTFSGQ